MNVFLRPSEGFISLRICTKKASECIFNVSYFSLLKSNAYNVSVSHNKGSKRSS